MTELTFLIGSFFVFICVLCFFLVPKVKEYLNCESGKVHCELDFVDTRYANSLLSLEKANNELSKTDEIIYQKTLQAKERLDMLIVNLRKEIKEEIDSLHNRIKKQMWLYEKKVNKDLRRSVSSEIIQRAKLKVIEKGPDSSFQKDFIKKLVTLLEEQKRI